MRHRWLGVIALALPTLLAAQIGKGPYARIAVLRPHDGQTTEFEAGYLRHLAWHQKAGDPWTWYGYSIWAGDRYRWFVYASFGHSATSFDSLVSPADDERDNVLNVEPHVEWVTNGLYEFLPSLSHGTGEPEPTPRLEYTAVDLLPGAETAEAFERVLAASRSSLKTETLWYRLVAGGTTPRYIRLRTLPGLSAILRESGRQELPDAVKPLVNKITVEIWTLRPTMGLGVGPPPRR
jgi:hypothetical protein